MVKISVELDRAKMKLSDGNIRRGRFALANQALADMNQYVPMDEGHLRLTATIDIDGSAVNYNTPYAKAQYYGYRETKDGKVFFRNYTTPGTGPKWDEKAKGIHMKEWEKAFLKGAEL